MKYEKKNINRAVYELKECLANILNADRNQYDLRIRQLLLTIKNNEIMNTIIMPYLDLNLDMDKFGLIDTGYSQCDFNIPENEDEEISLILQTLKSMTEIEGSIDGWTWSIYNQNSFDENLFLFNKKIIEPAFNKLLRKLQYKLEDISAINEEKIEAGDITIINIKEFKANHSMIAMGKNIKQQSENIFDEIRNEISSKVENENDKNELLSCVNEMEKSKDNKEVFRTFYNKFINRLGIYMRIIGPLLPYLVEYII